MSTGRGVAGGGAIAAAIALAGCGSGTTASTTGAAKAVGWGTLRLASGAALPYPLSWRRIQSDNGSASAALFNADGTIRAYLNVTPAIGSETLANWARFQSGTTPTKATGTCGCCQSRRTFRSTAGGVRA